MKIMGVTKVAEKLGVSTPTIYRWVQGEGFPAPFELAGKSVWDEEDIDNWLKAKKEMSNGNGRKREAEAV